MAKRKYDGVYSADPDMEPSAEFIAERRGIGYTELEAAVDANAARLFGW